MIAFSAVTAPRSSRMGPRCCAGSCPCLLSPVGGAHPDRIAGVRLGAHLHRQRGPQPCGDGHAHRDDERRRGAGQPRALVRSAPFVRALARAASAERRVRRPPAAQRRELQGRRRPCPMTRQDHRHDKHRNRRQSVQLGAMETARPWPTHGQSAPRTVTGDAPGSKRPGRLNGQVGGSAEPGTITASASTLTITVVAVVRASTCKPPLGTWLLASARPLRHRAPPAARWPRRSRHWTWTGTTPIEQTSTASSATRPDAANAAATVTAPRWLPLIRPHHHSLRCGGPAAQDRRPLASGHPAKAPKLLRRNLMMAGMICRIWLRIASSVMILEARRRRT